MYLDNKLNVNDWYSWGVMHMSCKVTSWIWQLKHIRTSLRESASYTSLISLGKIIDLPHKKFLHACSCTSVPQIFESNLLLSRIPSTTFTYSRLDNNPTFVYPATLPAPLHSLPYGRLFALFFYVKRLASNSPPSSTFPRQVQTTRLSCSHLTLDQHRIVSFIFAIRYLA